MQKYTFELPDNWHNSDIINAEVREFLKKNADRCRMLLLIYKIPPISHKEIQERIGTRDKVYNWLKFLIEKDVVKIYNGKDTLEYNGQNNIISQVKKKYLERTDGYEFRRKSPIYYYVVSEYGENHIPFACECLGIEVNNEHD